MTYYGSKELAHAFRTVRNNTIAIARDIPEEQYGFRATPDTRSVGETLVHISAGSRLQEQIHRDEHRTTLVGFDFPAFLKSIIALEQTPRTKAQIIELLQQSGESFANWLDTLTDEFLGEPVGMPPGAVPATKSRFEMILGVKEHEMHHRGQLMVLERMVGVTPHLTRAMQERMAAHASQKD